MIKFLALFLALVMVLPLTACGAKAEDPAAEAPKPEAYAPGKARYADLYQNTKEIMHRF